MAFWRSLRYAPITSSTTASLMVPEKSLAVRRSWIRVLIIRTTSAVGASLVLMAWVRRSVSSCSRLMGGPRRSGRGRRLQGALDLEGGDDDHDAGGDGHDAKGRHVGEHAHHRMGHEEDAEDPLHETEEGSAPRQMPLEEPEEVDEAGHDGGEGEEEIAEGDGDQGAQDGMDHDDHPGGDAEHRAENAPAAIGLVMVAPALHESGD